MIEAAIEIFGASGYEAASTRALAERAGVNLAAIPYHFGGKWELYLAAAQTIADYAREQLNPVVAQLQDQEKADPISRIEDAVSSVFHLVVGGTEPQAWAAYFIHCEHAADDAFRIIYDAVFTRFEKTLRQRIAEVVGCDVNDEALKMRVAVVLTSIVSLRALRNTTLSLLGWDRLDASRLQRLDTTVRELARRELFSCPNTHPHSPKGMN